MLSGLEWWPLAIALGVHLTSLNGSLIDVSVCGYSDQFVCQPKQKPILVLIDIMMVDQPATLLTSSPMVILTQHVSKGQHTESNDLSSHKEPLSLG